MAQPKIKLTLDDSDVTAGLERVAGSFGDLFGAIKTGFNEAAALVQTFSKFTLDLALKGAEAERVERRLFQSMQLRTGLTREGFADLQAFNDELQKKLGLDADDLAQLQGTLSLRGVANDQLEQATKFVIGLSEAGIEQGKALKIVTDAYDGNFKSLSKLIPAVKDAESAFNELNKLSEVAEKNSGDLISQWDRFKASIGDVEENLGKGIEKTDAFDVVLGVFQARVDGVNEALSTNDNGLAGVLGIVAEQAFLNLTTFGMIGTQFELLDAAINKTTEDVKTFKDEFAGITPFIGAPFALPPQTPFKDKPGKGKKPGKFDRQESSTSNLPGAFGGFGLGLLGGEDTGNPFIVGFDEGQAEAEAAQREAAEQALDEQIALQKKEEAAAKRHRDRMLEINQQRIADMNHTYAELVGITANGVVSMAGEIARGETKVGPAMVKLLGTLASTIIPPLLAMATATTESGIAASTIGTPAAVVSGPLLAAAVGAFGIAVSAIGASTAARGNAALSQARSGRAPTFGSTSSTVRQVRDLLNAPTRLDRDSQRGSGVTNIYFGATAIVGSEDEVARKIARLVDRNRRLARA